MSTETVQPCPPWCTDHDVADGLAFHNGPPHVARVDMLTDTMEITATVTQDIAATEAWIVFRGQGEESGNWVLPLDLDEARQVAASLAAAVADLERTAPA